MNCFSLKIIKQIIEKERKGQKRRKREKNLAKLLQRLSRKKRKTNKLEQTIFFDAAKAKNKHWVFTKFHLNKCFPSKQIESSSKRNAVALSTISSQ